MLYQPVDLRVANQEFYEWMIYLEVVYVNDELRGEKEEDKNMKNKVGGGS